MISEPVRATGIDRQPSGEPERIDPAKRVAIRIIIEVDATFDPYRIFADQPANRRIVITGSVIRQPGL